MQKKKHEWDYDKIPVETMDKEWPDEVDDDLKAARRYVQPITLEDRDDRHSTSD